VTDLSDKVLKGNWVIAESTPEHIKSFLTHVATPQVIQNNPTTMEMTITSYVAFWKHAKENISCYPSELSFSTMKASSHDNYLSTIDCVMTRIPLQTGYSPLRWQRCVDVMIPKKSNMTDIDNLRTICLFKVDANYAFKHIGRKMMHNAELHHTLAQEQYGSRKKHRAIDLALNKVLTNDLL
jgi:hypothetical protein